MKGINENDLQQVAWELGDWEESLTINVGSAYCCRACGNLVMVTRGGLGVLQLNCCGEDMQRVQKAKGQ